MAFHPHLYTRTRDFMDEFVAALSVADEVVVAPIYAAREEPIEGVASEVLAEKIGRKAVAVEDLNEVFLLLKEKDAKNIVFITMGAGDVYKVSRELTIN